MSYVVLKNKQTNLLLTNFPHLTPTIATYTPRYDCKPDLKKKEGIISFVICCFKKQTK